MLTATGIDTVSFSQQLTAIYSSYTPKRYESGSSYSSTAGEDFTLSLSDEAKRVQALAYASRYYDVHNISLNDMREMSKGLYQDGVLTLSEHAMLSMRGDLHPEANRALSMMDVNPLNNQQEFDAVELWQSQIVQAESGSLQISNEALAVSRRIASTLRAIDAMRNH